MFHRYTARVAARSGARSRCVRVPARRVRCGPPYHNEHEPTGRLRRKLSRRPPAARTADEQGPHVRDEPREFQHRRSRGGAGAGPRPGPTDDARGGRLGAGVFAAVLPDPEQRGPRGRGRRRRLDRSRVQRRALCPARPRDDHAGTLRRRGGTDSFLPGNVPPPGRPLRQTLRQSGGPPLLLRNTLRHYYQIRRRTQRRARRQHCVPHRQTLRPLHDGELRGVRHGGELRGHPGARTVPALSQCERRHCGGGRVGGAGLLRGTHQCHYSRGRITGQSGGVRGQRTRQRGRPDGVYAYLSQSGDRGGVPGDARREGGRD
mmetsp:Transcript_18752/g.37344  ORF Transcript_18752/g.37344 Transcript_18752/m.37344 type:complete len:318 (-) Transcript_18752:1062-2015(-)